MSECSYNGNVFMAFKGVMISSINLWIMTNQIISYLSQSSNLCVIIKNLSTTINHQFFI